VEQTLNIKKRQVKLPIQVEYIFHAMKDQDDRDDYIRALNKAGWTQTSIANVINLSRERVRQICSSPEKQAQTKATFYVPTPPVHEVKVKRVPVEPSEETLDRLIDLKPYAQQVRANSKRYRAEAEEYTQLINKARQDEGVTLFHLAKRLGVTHTALRLRLARYGYMTPGAEVKSRAYTPIKKENRATL
jgi:transcriptional regulator with GAF, ATPase, and Fis domain